MAYLKDIKLCIDCAFFGTPQGQRDRCLNPKLTMINPVHGEEVYPLAFSERTGLSSNSCGSKAQHFALNEDAAADRAKKAKELDEVMRDCPF
jgi:hypothetical protein